AWGGGLLLAWMLQQLGLHLFFLLVPTWLATTVIYMVLAFLMGAGDDYSEQAVPFELAEADRRAQEQLYLRHQTQSSPEAGPKGAGLTLQLARAVALLSLAACAVMAWLVFADGSLEVFRRWLIFPSIIYFIAATVWVSQRDKLDSTVV